MKKIFSITLLLSSLCFVLNAQTIEKKAVDRKPTGQGKPVYYLDNVKMDARALKHYKTEDQIKQMPTYKKFQVNYYYQKSYELFIPDGCSYNAVDFDITQYESQRKQDSRNRVNISNACGSYVVLHSRSELESAYEKILEENSK